MWFSDVLGLLVALALVVLTGAAVVRGERRRALRLLLVIGLVLRVVGSLVYFGLLETAYGGGDYDRYLSEATEVVESIEDPGRENRSVADRYGGRWWGTPSVSILTSWIMRVLGTSPAPIFVMYGLLSFLAAVSFLYAFRNAFPEIDPKNYALWLMLFPSLWFWPSPVGKDAPVLLGIGLAFLGVLGSRGRRNYMWVALGAAITLVVRPQYALVFVAAALGGLVLGRQSASRGGVAKATAIAVFVVGAVYVVSVSADFLGFDVLQTQDTADWIGRRGEVTAYGSSAFEAARNPLTGVFNVLFRPFPWEATGVFVLMSSIEVSVLWILLYRRRRAIALFLRRYRKTEAFWISLLFTLALAAAAGMAVGNFGTLVRQRVHLYPFLFLITASIPARRIVRRRGIARVVAGPPSPISA